MKIVKMAALLITALLCNNLQSMELPIDYPLEERLVSGAITVEQYLSILEDTSEYGSMLRDLRTAVYMNQADNIYMNLIENMRGQLNYMQELLSERIEDRYWANREMTRERYIGMIHNNVRSSISALYENLKSLLSQGRARMPRLS